MKAEFTNSAEVATLKIYDYVGKYEEVNTENIQNQLDEIYTGTISMQISTSKTRVDLTQVILTIFNKEIHITWAI